jgi:hypothetical protein
VLDKKEVCGKEKDRKQKSFDGTHKMEILFAIGQGRDGREREY